MSDPRTIKTDDRTLPFAGALKDESDLVWPEIEEKTPFYVLRLMNGASVTESPTGKTIHIRSCGNEFVISPEAYNKIKLVYERVKKEDCDSAGMSPPFNTEDQIRILFSARKLASHEFNFEPKLLRVYFLRQDTGGCGWYRVMQPTRALNQYFGKHVIAEESDWLTFPLGQKYDVIVAPRVSHPQVIGILKNLQKCGKIIVYETDDLLSKLPDYNPIKELHDESDAYRQFFIKMADACIVSTEQLAVALGQENKTFVCHNAISPELWPMKVRNQKTDRVRILWAGSSTHEGDLRVLVPVVKKLIEKFKNKIEMIWVNYMPTDFVSAYRDNAGRVGGTVSPQYREFMRLVEGCHVSMWPTLLDSVDPHICLAPLADNDFNRSKSELKVIESWALGSPIVASQIGPYMRAVDHGRNGILCNDNPDVWYNEIRRLIEDPAKRTELANNGLVDLHQFYLAEHIAKDYLRALCTIANGKTVRSECNDAIKTLMEECKWYPQIG